MGDFVPACAVSADGRAVAVLLKHGHVLYLGARAAVCAVWGRCTLGGYELRSRRSTCVSASTPAWHGCVALRVPITGTSDAAPRAAPSLVQLAGDFARAAIADANVCVVALGACPRQLAASVRTQQWSTLPYTGPSLATALHAAGIVTCFDAFPALATGGDSDPAADEAPAKRRRGAVDTGPVAQYTAWCHTHGDLRLLRGDVQDPSSAPSRAQRSLRRIEPGADAVAAVDELISTARRGTLGRGAVVLICGAKGSGKSTLCRHVLNALCRLRQEPVLVDLDPGQPEVAPPGFLSLHRVSEPMFGPAFLHPAWPTEARYFGHASPEGDPGLYWAAASSLLDSARKLVVEGHCVVVNTMGWVKSLGAELLHATAAAAEPDLVLQLQPAGHGRRVMIPASSLPAHAKTVSVDAATTRGQGAKGGDPAAVPAASPPNPAQQRFWRVEAHLGGLPPQRTRDGQCVKLAAAEEEEEEEEVESAGPGPVYVVPAAALSVAFLVEDPPAGVGVVTCLAGTVVALARRDPAHPPAVLSPAAVDGATPCLGIGLVVGSDGHTLRIATRCPPSALAGVNLLIVGDQGSYAEPAHALAGAGVGDVAHPLLSADVLANVGTGAGVMRARGPMPRGPAPK